MGVGEISFLYSIQDPLEFCPMTSAVLSRGSSLSQCNLLYLCINIRDYVNKYSCFISLSLSLVLKSIDMLLMLTRKVKNSFSNTTAPLEMVSQNFKILLIMMRH